MTNQPDVARGTLDAAEVDRMHERLRSRVPLDEICVCVHDDADVCACRKPQPGMLLDAADAAGPRSGPQRHASETDGVTSKRPSAPG